MDVRKNLVLAIRKKLKSLEKMYEGTPLNGLKTLSKDAFLILAFENVLQGLWNRSFDTCTYDFNGNIRTVEIDNKIIKKVFGRLITYSENSEQLYWDILYSMLTLRNVTKDITQHKILIGDYLKSQKELFNYKDRNKIHHRDPITNLIKTASLVNNTTYGTFSSSDSGD